MIDLPCPALAGLRLTDWTNYRGVLHVLLGYWQASNTGFGPTLGYDSLSTETENRIRIARQDSYTVIRIFCSLTEPFTKRLGHRDQGLKFIILYWDNITLFYRRIEQLGFVAWIASSYNWLDHVLQNSIWFKLS